MLKCSRYLVVIMFSLVFAFGCSTAQKHIAVENKKLEIPNDKIDKAASDRLDFVLDSDSDSQKISGLNSIHFSYSSVMLDSENKKTLMSNVDFLKRYLKLKIQIEGHCDERGSLQFNLALGEKRANTVKDFLIDQGIAPDRLEVLSIGKERPISLGHDENSWRQNRRTNFVIIQK